MSKHNIKRRRKKRVQTPEDYNKTKLNHKTKETIIFFYVCRKEKVSNNINSI